MYKETEYFRVLPAELSGERQASSDFTPNLPFHTENQGISATLDGEVCAVTVPQRHSTTAIAEAQNRAQSGPDRPKGPKTRDNWIVDPATGCHLWSRCIDKDGYGYFRCNRKQVRAHVHYYELEHGGIPAGMEPDHLCRTRHCVNPDHIEIVPKIVNIRRGKAAKLTMDKAREIRRLAAEGMPHSDIGQRFGVKPITVYFVVSNRLWKESAPSPASILEKGAA